ncbi:putative Membrane transporter protein [Burkholderia latens]|uniref:hypothetical protein n=1 Tax=Burkholderia latens TaxID=488446 RepID=UPI0039A6C3CC
MNATQNPDTYFNRNRAWLVPFVVFVIAATSPLLAGTVIASDPGLTHYMPFLNSFSWAVSALAIIGVVIGVARTDTLSAMLVLRAGQLLMVVVAIELVRRVLMS